MAPRKADLDYLPTQTGPNKGAEPSAKEVDWSSGKWGCKIPQSPIFQLSLEAASEILNPHPPTPSIGEVKNVLLARSLVAGLDGSQLAVSPSCLELGSNAGMRWSGAVLAFLLGCVN